MILLFLDCEWADTLDWTGQSFIDTHEPLCA